MSLDFKERSAIVTGGAQGIGAAIAKRLEAQGAAVRVWDTSGSPAVDVSDPGSVAAATKSALADFGRIDVLVNNAGRTHVGAVEETTDEELRSLLDRKSVV